MQPISPRTCGFDSTKGQVVAFPSQCGISIRVMKRSSVILALQSNSLPRTLNADLTDTKFLSHHPGRFHLSFSLKPRLFLASIMAPRCTITHRSHGCCGRVAHPIVDRVQDCNACKPFEPCEPRARRLTIQRFCQPCSDQAKRDWEAANEHSQDTVRQNNK